MAGGCAWQWGMHGRGACVAGGMCGMHAPHQKLRDMVNEWEVRILLECILVLHNFEMHDILNDLLTSSKGFHAHFNQIKL